MEPPRSALTSCPYLHWFPCRRSMRAFLLAGLLVLTGCGVEPMPPLESDYPVPRQETLQESWVISKDGVTLTAKARYAVKAHVMSSRHYGASSPIDALVPVDLALAWGPVARDEVQQNLSVSQSGRWFHWRLRDVEQPVLSRGLLIASMANTHLIPDSPEIRAIIENVEAGDTVELSGYLVDAFDTKNQETRRSSLSRTDSGNGACELLLVTSVSVWKP